MSEGLSVLIITFNEEQNLDRCLSSLKNVADEIVVVDSYSKDKTKEIAELHGARFIENPFKGHIQQKNFAISQAKNNYILSLDADEALTPDLEKSILEVKKDFKRKGYSFNRLTNYCGKWVRHCGWYPDTKTRLIHKDFGSWQGENPHDRLDVDEEEKVMQLKGDLLHYSYYTKEDHFKQIEYFGDIAAKELHAKGKKTNLIQIAGKSIFQFFKSFIIKAGWMDGKTGILISLRSAYATYRKYVKLYRLS